MVCEQTKPSRPRDTIGDFAAAELATRDDEIASLKKQLADFQQKLEQQAAIDQRVHETMVTSSRLWAW
jgi:hypothetical protein